MDWNAYQQSAKQTAVYPREAAVVYPVLGLADEAGELLEKVIARADDADIIKEAGDVLWYVAIVADDLGVTLAAVAELATNVDATMYGVTFGAARVAGKMKKAIRDNNSLIDGQIKGAMAEGLATVLAGLRVVAFRVSSSLEEIAAINLAKLSDRANRGVIKGGGDNR